MTSTLISYKMALYLAAVNNAQAREHSCYTSVRDSDFKEAEEALKKIKMNGSGEFVLENADEITMVFIKGGCRRWSLITYSSTSQKYLG